MSSIDLESFKAGTGSYVLTFEKGLKIKPSDVGKVVTPFKLKGSGASIVRKVVKKDGAWVAGAFVLANKGKKGDRDFDDLLGEVAGLAESGQDTLKLTGDIEEGKKGKLTLRLTAIRVVRSLK